MSTLNEYYHNLTNEAFLMVEGAQEKAAVDFLSTMIKKSKFNGKVFIAGGYVRDEYDGNPSMTKKEAYELVRVAYGSFK